MHGQKNIIYIYIYIFTVVIICTGLWLVKLIAYQTPFFEARCINFVAECPLEIKGTVLFERSLT